MSQQKEKVLSVIDKITVLSVIDKITGVFTINDIVEFLPDSKKNSISAVLTYLEKLGEIHKTGQKQGLANEYIRKKVIPVKKPASQFESDRNRALLQEKILLEKENKILREIVESINKRRLVEILVEKMWDQA
jgi:hypothetical protein